MCIGQNTTCEIDVIVAVVVGHNVQNRLFDGSNATDRHIGVIRVYVYNNRTRVCRRWK